MPNVPADAVALLPAKMNFDIFNPSQLLENNIFREDAFIASTQDYDWERFSGKKVLVRGCESAVFPPWAFMIIGHRLGQFADSVRFGNEHDHVIVYRKPKK